MTRRRFLAAGAGLAYAAAATKRPNLVLIVADDLGYGDLGCYGATHVRTPALDRLAASGVRFTDFHSNGAVCSPTRAALLTGRYQQRSGVDEVINAMTMRDAGLPLGEITIAEVLRGSGYATALFGKWHLGYQPKFHPDRQGFDTFRGYVSGNVDYFSHVDQAGHTDWWEQGGKLVPEEGYSTELITNHALRFIDTHASQPFFLFIAHEAPHAPYQGPKDKPVRSVGEKGDPTAKRGDVRATYAAMVEAMDDGIGRVVARLESLPRDRETFVFFCSDNGGTPRGSNGPLRGFKGQLWEGGHRVPAIAYWPGRLRGGSVSNETAMTMDLFPVLLELAGARVPAGLALDGVSLIPALLGRKPPPERTLFWAHGTQRAVRWKQWKLTRMSPEAQPSLCDLSRDIAEENNLAGEYPDVVADLLRRLARWEQEVA